MALLTTTHLSKAFGKERAVSDLSLSVEAGDVYGFLGPNGAGKSTTMRMLVGLVRPSAGSVRLFGERLTLWSRKPLRRIGAVIERPSFYSHLTGRQNLRLFSDLSGGSDKARIDEVLDRVGLASRADDKAQIYSHGMKQRLAIAAALLPKPELVLLDEPTNGLDPIGIRAIRELIQSLARDDGLTVFLSSHLLTEIEQVCNRALVINQGRSIWQGNVEELLQARRRIRLIATPDATVRELLNKLIPEASILKEPEGEALLLRNAEVACHKIVAELVNAGCEVHEIIDEIPPLEEAFVELIEKDRAS